MILLLSLSSRQTASQIFICVQSNPTSLILLTKPIITMTKETMTDARAILAAQFKDVPPSSHGQKWDDLYAKNILPWDKGSPNPALVALLAAGKEFGISSTNTSGKERKKALVPGCGKGYDVLLLSACGYDAYGLEVSSRALEAARETEKEMAGKGGVYGLREGVERGDVTWLTGDFFEDGFLEGVEGVGKFDLIYDYTVCARVPIVPLSPLRRVRVKRLGLLLIGR